MAPMPLQEFVERANGATRPSELRQVMLDFYHSRGARMVVYHAPPLLLAGKPAASTPNIFAEGFPEAWLEEYIREGMVRHDPIPQFALNSTRPFFWSEIERLVRLTPEQEGVLRKARSANLGDGLAIQVFGPQLRNGYIGLGFGQTRPDLTAQDIMQFQLASQIGHNLLGELTSRIAAERLVLSGREQQVLEWIARGKSTSVIAEILDLSPHTVDTLTRRLFSKLNVGDRTAAVVAGLSAGLVRL